MSDSECRNALVAILQGMTTYFPANAQTGEIPVNLGRATVLDTGVSHAAVFYPGRFESEDSVAYQSPKHWELVFDLFQRMDSDEATNWANFIALQGAVVAEIDRWPHLNKTNGVSSVTVSADNDPIIVKRTTTSQEFIWQSIRVRVVQYVDIVPKE